MSTGQIVALGAIAGLTIFLGLPLGRIDNPAPRLHVALSALAAGILVFLLWDVLAHGVEPVEKALEQSVAGDGSWGEFAGLAALLAGGLVAGLMSLVYYDSWMKRRRSSDLVGPGAAAVDEFVSRPYLERLSPTHRIAFLIAVGIGLHNFSEGLAIGQAGATGEISLALALIIGFGLHNATEGFAVVGPMSAEEERPTWAFLALLGLIGGGPTFLGTIVGTRVGERGRLGRLPRPRGGLDPLRAPGGPERHAEARVPDPRRVDAPARPLSRLRDGLRARGRRARQLRSFSRA